ncbi:hypothetical protein HYU16_01730 [Candidatus Woesearchaeota archaeon]|nr:hypothetical protein [Candidatus Woesearchaeota archaeon]
MVDAFVSVPVKNVNGQDWLILNSLSNRGLLRAVKIEKRKRPVPDWDGHHCDEAAAEGSIRYYPKRWQV